MHLARRPRGPIQASHAVAGPSGAAAHQAMPRRSEALMLALTLLLCASPFAGARRRPKSRGSAGQRQAPPPATTDLATGPSKAAAAVRHLFATPLYVSDVSSSVDAQQLSDLALEGYGTVESSASVQDAMVDLKLATLGREASPEAAAELRDDNVFTHNDKFFYYQIGNAAKCVDGSAPECGGVRWDSFFASGESGALRQLEAAIADAVPPYFASAGVSEEEIPPYAIKLWASVMAPGASHTEHEHSSGGECLASGVFYAKAPPGSGALRFTDHRQHLKSHPLAFPTASYDLLPEVGQLVLFPPWQGHQVLASDYSDAAAAAAAERRVSWAFNIMVKTTARDGPPPARTAEAVVEAAVASQDDLLDGLLDEL